MSEMDWGENQVANEILQYVKEKSESDESLQIPYQFFIPFLFSLYYKILGNDNDKINKCCFQNGGLKTSIGQVIITYNDLIIPTSPPLCAIAYLSWEKEHRLFVARRVWPATLHFLGHSYIPDGWGVVGKLTKALQNEYNGQRPVDWMDEFCIRDINADSKQGILPFMRDINTLRYNSVSALPIFKNLNDRQNHFLQVQEPLLGTLVFFFNEKSPSLPDSRWQNKLSDSLSVALGKHLETITGKQCIADTWVDLLETSDSIKIASLKLLNGAAEVRNSMQAIILEAMSRPDFYAVIDSGNNDILIAPRDVEENGRFNREYVESVILNAVSQARLKIGISETVDIESELLWLLPQTRD